MPRRAIRTLSSLESRTDLDLGAIGQAAVRRGGNCRNAAMEAAPCSLMNLWARCSSRGTTTPMSMARDTSLPGQPDVAPEGTLMPRRTNCARRGGHLQAKAGTFESPEQAAIMPE